eukprot:CAMPEP_0171310036 /NCGR_PEP_ID=MMETSP0816-20121228/20239_1 /TAXON_ID=420281 /ORGANISM="Proboscia inermis, Strain CCAP1064/1" /LENGTH=449 /DNA_ID=CAMNT_0011793957 /DNA_START=211 /DNA_END=1561 /DNA_ORIENTATION=-
MVLVSSLVVVLAVTVTGFSPRIHRFQASHTLPLPRYSNALHSPTKHKPRIPTLPRGRVLSSSNDPDCTVEPQTSLSGVSYEDVQTELERLYPSEGIDQRNALSRTDGYWKFIQRGEDPPMQFTYGEFDANFLGQLLDRCHAHYYSKKSGCADTKPADWEGKVFADIGSGTGRLVLAASALHPTFSKCKGLEILPGLHQRAVEIGHTVCDLVEISKDKNNNDGDNDNGGNGITTLRKGSLSPTLPLSPELQFTCGSFTDPYIHLSDVDIAFCFSSCMDPPLLTFLSAALGRQCQTGTLIITTEYPLPLTGTIPPLDGDDTMPFGEYELEIVEVLDGDCELLGGVSTAYIHRVVSSLYQPGIDGVGPRSKPVPTLEQICQGLVVEIEEGTLVDTEQFTKVIHNDMMFKGLGVDTLREMNDRANRKVEESGPSSDNDNDDEDDNQATKLLDI